MRRIVSRPNALVPLVFGAIVLAYVLGRLWIERPRGEARATTSELIQPDAPPVR
jgi:hypothetical protein